MPNRGTQQHHNTTETQNPLTKNENRNGKSKHTHVKIQDTKRKAKNTRRANIYKHYTQDPQILYKIQTANYMKRYINRMIFHTKQEREEVINTDSGNRTPSFASINPDVLTRGETQQMVTDALQRNKIQIAPIQETHYPYDHNYIYTMDIES